MTQASVLDLATAQMEVRRRQLLAALSIVLGTVLIAISARIQFPIPGSTVPFTMQTVTVILLGMALGPRLGALTALLYLVECVAVPGLSATGRVALTGGYLVGFVAAAWCAGALFRRGLGRSLGRSLVAMTAANLVIFLFGVPWLAASIGWEAAWQQGFVAFLVVEAAKIAACTPMMRGVSAFAGAMERRLG